MNVKPVFITLAIIAFAWALWSGALAAGFEKIGIQNDHKNVKIEKIGQKSIVDQFYSRSKTYPVIRRIETYWSDVGGPEFIQHCRQEPVLCGMLFIFVGVSACGIAFIVHLIRNDARFS